MKVPLEWLREWSQWKGSPQELAEKLTQSGTEVVAIHSTGCQVRGIVSAKILEKKPHPNADRLSVCVVDDGTGSRQVVCGAKNHQAGDIVPLAKPGTVFQDGMTIKSAKLRGENSEGMLCSSKELGLAEDSEGLLILPPATALGLPLEKLFPGEVVIEVEITSNRPDLASICGLARELSALGVPLKERVAVPATDQEGLKNWKVSTEDAKLCPHYTLTGLEVKAGIDSPDWMKKRLVAAGLRSLGLLVDVTNYVLLETGQPVHVFDATRVQGSALEVRKAKAGESVTGIDGGKHTLTPNDLVVADGKGVVALAGIVGGADSAVQPTTQKVLLEVASFDAGTVRRAARRLSINTESSKRFARGGLDPELVERARSRVVQLLQDAGALEKYLGLCSVGAAGNLKVAPVPLRWEKAEKILGYKMDRENLTQRLGSLGFYKEKGGWVAPSWRRDVREEIDLFEELVRLSDLSKVPTSLDSLVDGESGEDREDQLRRQIRTFLVERGYFEVLSGALVRSDEAGSARLTLSAGPDASGYRQSLLPNLSRAAGRNISRGVTDLKLFELGRVSVEGGREEMRLGLLVSGRERPVYWQEPEVDVDRFSLQGIWQELGKRFSGLGQPLTLKEMSPTEKKSVGVKSTVWIAEGKVSVAKARLTPFTSVSSYPGIQRDMALVLPEKVSFADVEKAIRAAAPAEMESLVVFDRFVDPSGKKVPKGFLSLGCRLQFRSSARTLTEQEVGGWEKAILQSLASRCEAKLRTVL
jgi:phenylalanyl-tRNA synthetase beta chain